MLYGGNCEVLFLGAVLIAHLKKMEKNIPISEHFTEAVVVVKGVK